MITKLNGIYATLFSNAKTIQRTLTNRHFNRKLLRKHSLFVSELVEIIADHLDI